jgi:VanZ family protein
MGLIWYLSDQPDLKSNLEQDFLLRKVAHVTEFAVLTFMVSYAGRFSFSRRSTVTLAVVWAAIYAGLDEWHQSWVMGRHGSLVDVGIDVVGIVVAIIIWLAITKTTARAGSGSNVMPK